MTELKSEKGGSRSLMRGGRMVWGLFAMILGFFVLALFFDARVTRTLMAWPESERAFFAWLTPFGEGAVVLVPALVLWLVGLVGWKLVRSYWCRWSLRALSALSMFAFAAVGIPGLVSAILKRLFGRARPIWIDAEGVLSFRFLSHFSWDFQSFPSGHATTSLAFALAMALLFGPWGAWVFVPAVLIALSRIVIGMHYLSDVLFGAGLGLALGLMVAEYWRRKGWVFAAGPGWRNRFAPVLVHQWRRTVRIMRRDVRKS